MFGKGGLDVGTRLPGLASVTTAATSVLIALVVGCSAGVASPTIPVKEPYTQEPPTPTLSVLATVAPSGHGRPYTVGDMAALLRDAAARPAGFAAEVATPQLLETMAGVLADQVYSYDGTPYQRVTMSARCDGPPVEQCDLALTGIPAFTDDPEIRDDYLWTVDPVTGRMSMIDHWLGGFPDTLTASLDALAQSLDVDGRYKDRYLVRVGWELAPPDDAYVLRYTNGLGEGDLVFLVTVDRAARRIVSIRELPG